MHSTRSFPSHFNETLMFNDTAALELKAAFREKFRNISRIMDCVGCDKCRLWGKLQVFHPFAAFEDQVGLCFCSNSNWIFRLSLNRFKDWEQPWKFCTRASLTMMCKYGQINPNRWKIHCDRSRNWKEAKLCRYSMRSAGELKIPFELFIWWHEKQLHVLINWLFFSSFHRHPDYQIV